MPHLANHFLVREARHFRADEEDLDLFVQTELVNGWKVEDVEIDILATVSRPGISGSNEQGITEGARSDLPGQSVFTTSTAQE